MRLESRCNLLFRCTSIDVETAFSCDFDHCKAILNIVAILYQSSSNRCGIDVPAPPGTSDNFSFGTSNSNERTIEIFSKHLLPSRMECPDTNNTGPMNIYNLDESKEKPAATTISVPEAVLLLAATKQTWMLSGPCSQGAIILDLGKDLWESSRMRSSPPTIGMPRANLLRNWQRSNIAVSFSCFRFVLAKYQAIQEGGFPKAIELRYSGDSRRGDVGENEGFVVEAH